MSASFWRFGNNYQTIPEITNILQKPDFTLEEILDDQEIIQELISENGALIEYLGTPEVLEKLVKYIVEDDDFQISMEEDDVSNESQKDSTTIISNDENDESNDENDINRVTNHDDDFTTATTNNDDNDDFKNEEEDRSNYDESNYGSNNNFDDDDDDEEEEEEEEEKEEEEEEEETPEDSHHRRAQILAEILSQENWTITHAFMKDHPHLLETLWTILDKPAPLSMSSSTYFMKINEHLLDQHLEDMIKFILSQESLVDRFMRHIDNPPLMDFLLKVISTDKGRELSTGVIDVLQEKKLIPSLISFLGPDHPSTEQSAALDFLKAFITISANSNTDNSTIGPNELTRELVSNETVQELARLMLYGGSGLLNSVGIIIEIIRKNNSDYDIVPVLYITIKSHPPLPTDPIYLGTLVKIFAENIPNFTAMLEKPTLQVLETPFGSIEPLGFERFKICELVAELLHCSNMALLNDEKGESIVNERDEERIRLKQLAKKLQRQDEDNQLGDDEDDGETGHRHSYGEEDISRDIHNLDISENDEDEDDQFHNVSDDMIITEEDEEDKQQHEADYSVDMDEGDQQQQQQQQQPQSNEEEEKMIRENPVVGDQLKIALSDNNVIITILDMFFKFPWNNFLHNVVFDIVQQVLNGSMEIGYNKFLAIELFGKGNITKLIIEGQKKCEDYEEQTGLRLGYMGHLTLIAEEVVKFISLYSPESISMVIHDAVSDEEWNRYVNETLVETREKYNAILGGTIGDEEDIDDDSQGLILDPSQDHDLRGVSYQEEEDDDDEDDDDYHSLDASQNLDPHHHYQGDDDDDEEEEEDSNQFSRYMSQQMTSDLPDKFGSSDEDDDEDEPGSWTMSSDFTSKINNANQDYHHRHQLSQQQQKQHMSNGSGEDEEEEEDDDIEIINNEHHNEEYEDDYVDPNDDGQSYTKKNHPLYTPTGDLIDQFHSPTGDNKHYQHHQQQQHNYQVALGEDEYNTDPLSDEESDDEESNIQELGEEEEEAGEEDLGLIRSTSKGDMGWDDDEQRRLMTVASYIQSNNHGNEK